MAGRLRRRVLELGVAGALLAPCTCRAAAAEGLDRLSLTPARVVPGTVTRVTYRNPDLSGRKVYVHFGADGWNFRLPGATSETVQGNTNYYRHELMRYDADAGGHVLDIDVPLGVRALHFAFCWDACGPNEWDNNDTRDYGWPVVFPYIGPVLTWNERTHPASGVVVAFETGFAAPAWIEYWRDGQAPARRAARSSLIHRFELTGLAANARYNYRVGVGSTFISPLYRFTTAPTFGGLERLSFIVVGDAQDNGEDGRWAVVADEIAARHGDVDFVLSTGDLPWGDHPGDWWTFFDRARALFGSLVVMPVLGNHDTPTVDSHPDHRSWLRYFALPATTADRGYFHFSFGPAAFYGMNSERPDELAAGGGQYRWLDDHLEARRRRQDYVQRPLWNFAYWHVPPFNAGARHWQQQYCLRDAAGLFDDVIDWHFGGHEHLYQRMRPLSDAGGAPEIQDRYGRGADAGVGYLVVPASGIAGSTQLVSRGDRPELRERLAYPGTTRDGDQAAGSIGFARVEIAGNHMDLKVLRIPASGGAATLMDRVQYDRR